MLVHAIAPSAVSQRQKKKELSGAALDPDPTATLQQDGPKPPGGLVERASRVVKV